jgi:hypothetical protein
LRRLTKRQIGIENRARDTAREPQMCMPQTAESESVWHRFVRFALRWSRKRVRKAIRCIIFFAARQRDAPAVVAMVNASHRMAHRAHQCRQIKIGDVAETLISSAFSCCVENFARNRTNGTIFAALAAARARIAARAASGGGAYTQN